MKKMYFWDYIESDDNKGADVKSKKFTERLVAASHHLFRNFMGPVDQSDAKSKVMGLCREKVNAWHNKQLRFLIEAAVI